MKTVLNKLKSKSTTKGGLDNIHHTLTAFGLRLTPEDLAMALAEHLDSQIGVNRNHNARIKAIDDGGASLDHLSRTLDYLSTKYMSGLGFVKCLGEDIYGDIGIAYNISYVVSDLPKTKPLEEAAADLLLPLGNPEFGVSFHIQLALPNGYNTTVRITNSRPMDDMEGFIEYKSFYWDPVSEKADKNAESDVQST